MSFEMRSTLVAELQGLPFANANNFWPVFRVILLADCYGNRQMQIRRSNGLLEMTISSFFRNVFIGYQWRRL